MKIFPDKLAKKIPSDFKDNINSMSTEEIHKKIIECEGNVYNIEDELDSNEEILKLKEELKISTSPFRERKREEMAKIKYALWVLEERGLEIGKEQE